MPIAIGHRGKRLVLGRLPGGGQGGHRPTVKRPIRADHHMTTVTGPLSGQLHGALVGLSPTVGKEHLPAATQQPVQRLGHRPGVLGGIQV